MKPAELREIDRPWRLWASTIIVSLLAFSVVFGFLILPIVQGRAAGLDAFTAICRAVGILPGSPAARQPTSTRQGPADDAGRVELHHYAIPRKAAAGGGRDRPRMRGMPR